MVSQQPTSRAHAALASGTRLRLLDAIRCAAQPPTVADLVRDSGLQRSSLRFHLNAMLRAGLIEAIPEASAGRGRPKLRYAPISALPSTAGYRLLAEILAASLRTNPQSQAKAPDEVIPETREKPRASGTSGLRLPLGRGSSEMVGTATAAHRAEAAGINWAMRELPVPLANGAARIGAFNRTVLATDALFVEMGFESRIEPAPARAENTGAGSSQVDLRLHACPFVAMAKDQPEIVCAAHLGVMRGYLDVLGAADTSAILIPWDTPGSCLARISFPADVASPLDSEPASSPAGTPTVSADAQGSLRTNAQRDGPQ